MSILCVPMGRTDIRCWWEQIIFLRGEPLRGFDEFYRRRVGSKASRRPSPTKLKARTVRLMTKPGVTHNHHAVVSHALASWSMLPRLALGGGTPRPMKLSAD